MYFDQKVAENTLKTGHLHRGVANSRVWFDRVFRFSRFLIDSASALLALDQCSRPGNFRRDRSYFCSLRIERSIFQIQQI